MGNDLEVLLSRPYEVFVGVRVVTIKIEGREVSSFKFIQYKLINRVSNPVLILYLGRDWISQGLKRPMILPRNR